jgi:hypothetical protein
MPRKSQKQEADECAAAVAEQQIAVAQELSKKQSTVERRSRADAVIAQPKGRVKLDAAQIRTIVGKRKAGASLIAIQAETGLKGHIVREVLRAKELVKVDSPERLARAQYMVALWSGKPLKEKVADPGKAPASRAVSRRRRPSDVARSTRGPVRWSLLLREHWIRPVACSVSAATAWRRPRPRRARVSIR